MKRFGRIRYFFVLYGLVACLFLSLAQFSGSVLCFERDGRVALEAALNGKCSDVYQDQQRAFINSETAVQLTAGHCQHCVDIPLTFKGIAYRQSTVHQLASWSISVPVPSAAAGNLIGYLATATEAVLPQPPPIRPAIHRHLRTIILLI